jgi:predicted PhzF superfamily epimerase YddE/YHI9
VRHEKLSATAVLQISQGVEMGRPSQIHVVVWEERGKLVPQVSGAAVTIFEGTLEA